MDYTCTAFEKLTISTSVSKLSTAVYGSDCMRARISIESTSIRWMISGGSPTTDVGHLANASDNPPILLFGLSEITKFRITSASTGSAVIQVSYSING